MKCTYCGGTDFYEGPSGGMSTNVLCANKECRHWFNSTPMTEGLEDLRRVEPSDEEKTATEATAQRELESKPARLVAEGFDLYFGGKPASDCLIEEPFNKYAATQDMVVRLCGYVDAMRVDLKGRAKSSCG